MAGKISVTEHPTGALCFIMETTDDSGRYECTETYYLPEGVRFEDVAVPPSHPSTVQQAKPLPAGMTASVLTAMVDKAVQDVNEQESSA